MEKELKSCTGVLLRADQTEHGHPSKWYTRGRNFRPKTNIFTFRPSVSATEFKGWIWPNVQFQNFLEKDVFCTFKNKLSGKLLQIKSCTYWIQWEFREKSTNMALYLHNQIKKKIRLFARYAKSPLIFTYIVHSASVSVFGLGPDVFPARYLVSA